MSLRHFLGHVPGSRKFKIILFIACSFCFAVIYHNGQVYSKFSRQGLSIHGRSANVDSVAHAFNAVLFSPEGQRFKLQNSFTIKSSEQINLWKNIVLPTEGPRKSFSFARHGEPLSLYSAGYPVDASKLQANLTVDNINLMLLSLRPSSTNGVNCRKLITGDQVEISVGGAMNRLRENEDKHMDIPTVGHCKKYIKDQKFIMSPITAMEGDFPLAYSILVYTELMLFQRILRIIYRPQNIYCIHIDKKSDKTFSETVRNVANCFENVFVATPSVDIQWGTFSVLEPELMCMEELLLRHKKWKYFINLTGQELPLRTNYELVKILSSINGSNLVEGSVKRANVNRWKAAGPPPHGITPVKGGVHVVLNRQFVDFAINNKIAKDLLDWCRKVEIPDESFFSTLHNNQHLNIPGSYKGPPETDNDTNPSLARFKNWEDDWTCKGKYVRGICIFGVGDLPLLASREELFANKFHQNYQTSTLDCLEELLINRTIEETIGTLVFNTSYYRTRNFVLNKV